MINAFDIFNQQEKPHISLCNPDYEELYSLSAAYDTEITLKWNSQSEFSFTYPRSIDGINDLEAYDYLEGKRVVKIEGIGYFIIYRANEDYDGSTHIKRIDCLSHESELVFKKISLFNGTYQFYDSSNPSNQDTLMGVIMPMIPNWELNYIDSNIASLYRTFDISDTNIYQFLASQVAVAYGCVFNFDYLEKKINVFPVSGSTNATDIYLSFDNLLKNIEYEEITEEITTCLYCYGGNDLTIRSVNPLGTNSIYDFTYYKSLDWMDQGLIDAITTWEEKVESYTEEYNTLLDTVISQQETLLIYQAELATYQEQLSVLQGIRAVRVAAELDTTEIDAEIELIQGFYDGLNSLIEVIFDDIDDLSNQLSDINQELSLTNTSNFTNSQYLELNNFIFENTYKNDNIIQTESMDINEIQEQAQQLYDYAVIVLDRISIPRYEISIDSVNFLALKEFEPLIEQLELGSQLTIDSGKGYTIDATLLSIRFSWDDPSIFEIILGNKQRIQDNFTDFIGQTSLSSNNVSYGIINGVSTTGSNAVISISTGSSLGYVLENFTGQIGSDFITTSRYAASSLKVYINGILQIRGSTFDEGSDRRSFVMYDIILTGDNLMVEYIPSS